MPGLWCSYAWSCIGIDPHLLCEVALFKEFSMRSLSTFFVKTYGCQMNELDSEIMIGQLEQRGLRRTDEEESADLLIFNTCSIRDLAERKAMGKIGRLRKLGARRE